MKRIRVLIADDYPLLRKGLVSVFSSLDDFEVVGEAHDGHMALEEAERLRPDVILLDISMPGLDGIEVARALSGSAPEVRVVILSMHQSQDIALDAIKAGAMAYVLKDTDPEELTAAILKVMEGKKYFSPAIADGLLNNFIIKRDGDEDPLETLSGREREILSMIIVGVDNDEIARKLLVSVATVKKHRYNIMKKLDVNDMSGLIRTAIRRGLLKTSINP